jgi:hypothetical protein
VIAAACALAFAGCGGEGADEGEQAEAAEPGGPGGSVPGRLTATESGAEDIIAFALSGDRGAVVAGASSLGRSAGALARSGVAAAEVAEVAELRRRTTRLTRLATGAPFVDVALAANSVSQLMPRLYARFATRLRAGILELDYLDREAQFRSLAGQPGAVAAAVKELSRTWAGLRPGVVAAGGAKQASAYQAHVATMVRLSPANGGGIQAEARRGLELVDRLEQVVTE